MSKPTPQENQPGEPQDLDRPEPQAECHTPPNVIDGVTRYSTAYIQAGLCSPFAAFVLASDYIAERAKRLDAEKERDDARRAAVGYLDDAVHARAELLALRGKVGVEQKPTVVINQFDIECSPGGPEAKADGETRPGSTLREQVEKAYRVGLRVGIQLPPHSLTLDEETEWWLSSEPCLRLKPESGAPSPEPAAIPKTAREWWIAFPEHEGFTNANCRVRSYPPHPLDVHHKTVIHVREVVEGRKVSEEDAKFKRLFHETIQIAEGYRLEAEPLIKAADALRADPYNSKKLRPVIDAVEKIIFDRAEHRRDELLCVLSEEGGRQKEGGTETQIPNT